MQNRHKNHLLNEASLYLLQHAENPVNWYPWSEQAWEKARKENKLVLVSIGYSSCHWCHVMERESFVDERTAKIMNDNYVCIKVDREERPDIDQVYMSAVQLMTGSGGWPLNCFTLPDGKPIYGGTYFPNAKWKELLLNLKDYYQKNPDKAQTYADELMHGVRQTDFIASGIEEYSFSKDIVKKAVAAWKNYLDYSEGGPSRTPKFPLPNNYLFLMRYAYMEDDVPLLRQVELTLKKMAYGGIYDHLAGGFARYSTDSIWKIPHFEKMLYDNAQLIELYSEAFKLTKNNHYKQVALQTIGFLKRDMSDGKGGYFSAIDADSEGEEGKYYVWTSEEIKKARLPECGNADSYSVFADYYSINETGYWEKNNYVLFRRYPEEEIAAKYGIPVSRLNDFIAKAGTVLLAAREKREKPLTDKKIITSWNALTVSALCKAYQAFGAEDLRTEAIQIMNNILDHATQPDGKTVHLCSKSKSAAGFLEDYAFTISALINLYEITFDESRLAQAKKLADYSISHFYDEEDGLFWFTSDLDPKLVARKKEISDNVIAASNSEMANALFKLNLLLEERRYEEIIFRMLKNVSENFTRYPSSFSNWLTLLLNVTGTVHEIAITGELADEERKKLSSSYLPNSVFCGSSGDKSGLPLLQNRFQPGKTLIYVCRNKTCNLPVENSEMALSQISEK